MFFGEANRLPQSLLLFQLDVRSLARILNVCGCCSTALHYSLLAGHSACVKLLSATPGCHVNALDTDCRSALHYAALAHDQPKYGLSVYHCLFLSVCMSFHLRCCYPQCTASNNGNSTASLFL